MVFLVSAEVGITPHSKEVSASWPKGTSNLYCSDLFEMLTLEEGGQPHCVIAGWRLKLAIHPLSSIVAKRCRFLKSNTGILGSLDSMLDMPRE